MMAVQYGISTFVSVKPLVIFDEMRGQFPVDFLVIKSGKMRCFP